MSEQEWVHLDVAVIRKETEKAFNVQLEDGRIMWLPKSQISDADDYEAGDRDCTISVTAWIWEQKENGD